MDAYIASHPFPSYTKVTETLMASSDPWAFAMYTEYGKPHHEALRKAYESGMTREAIREAGQIIHYLGGMTAMQMNFYAFIHTSPFKDARHDPEIFYAYKKLEYDWDGIGEWVA